MCILVSLGDGTIEGGKIKLSTALWDTELEMPPRQDASEEPVPSIPVLVNGSKIGTPNPAVPWWFNFDPYPFDIVHKTRNASLAG